MAKIQAYKFVSTGVAEASRFSSVRAAAAPITAINNVGKTVEGIGNVIGDLNSIAKGTLAAQAKLNEQERRRLRQERDRAAEARQEAATSKLKTRKRNTNKDEEKVAKPSFLDKLKDTILQFLNPFTSWFKLLASLVIAKGVFDLLTDEEKREKFIETFEKAKCVFGKIFNFIKGSIEKVWSGWQKLTGNESSFLDRLGGLGEILLGLTGLWIAFNPLKALKGVFNLVMAGVDALFNRTPKPKKVDDPDGKPKTPSADAPDAPAPKKKNWLQQKADDALAFLDRKAKQAWGLTSDWAIKAYKALPEAVRKKWEAIAQLGKKLAKQGAEYGTKFANKVGDAKKFVTEGISSLGTKFKDFALQKILAPIKSLFEPLVSKIKGIGSKITDALMGSPVGKQIGEALKKKGINGIADTGNILKKVGGAALPVIGGVVNMLFAYDRFANGDPFGGLLEALSAGFDLSGLAGFVPGPGISMGIDAYMFARDLVPGIQQYEEGLINSIPYAKEIGNKMKEIGKKLPKLGDLVMPKAQEKAAGGIIAGAKSIIGMGKSTGDMCAATTRAALKAAGHPAATKRTQVGDLDTPKGTAYNGPNFAASFAGSDMGKIITNRSEMQAGDLLLWRADRDINPAKGILKGAVTHVGIAADKGAKNQYDHNRAKGFHYRPFWDSYGGTSWFAGVRLGGSGGTLPPSAGNEGSDDGANSTSTSGGNSVQSQSLKNPMEAFADFASKVTGVDVSKAFQTEEKAAASTLTPSYSDTATLGKYDFSQQFAMDQQDQFIPFPIVFDKATPVFITQPINIDTKIVFGSKSSFLDK